MSIDSPVVLGRVALVTGGTGFVGSHLIRHLIKTGWQVHAISRDESRISDKVNADALTWHHHDGSTAGMLQIMLKAKPDVVFHLASLFLAQHRAEDIQALIASNILFGAQVLEAMAQNGVRHLVNTGTSWQNYQNEDYNPVCLYAATKQAFEDIARYYVEACGLRMITLRLFDTYGPDDPRPKLFALLRKAMATGEVLDMSPGEQLIDLVYIDDVVAAYMLAAERLQKNMVQASEVYAISSGQPLPLRELVERFAHMVGKQIDVNWGGRPYRNREVMLPWSNGEKLPGWAPRVELEAGLRQVGR